jgi:hypothetical protein
MKNAAGRVVSPSTATIQSAMTDFNLAIIGGTLHTQVEFVVITSGSMFYRVEKNSGGMISDISNGNGTGTWPLAYTVFLTTLKSKQVQDCGPTQGLMLFLSWVQTNTRVATTISSQGWGPLTIVYERALINSFGTVQCNNDTALSTAYIIGMGGTITALDDWTAAYTSNSFVEKYYIYDTPTAITQMIEGTLDFGALSYAPDAQQWAQMPSVQLVPVLGQAGIPAYNVPNVQWQPQQPTAAATTNEDH